MIGRLTGKLIECNLTEVLLDVNGVGYDLLVPLSTTDKLPKLEQTVTLLTHLHVREDALTLYGFFTKKERDLFRLLLNNVSGIGPKLALNILSSMSADLFCAAVMDKDLKVLGKISGIGKRTAERIVLELHDKIGVMNPSASLGLGGLNHGEAAAPALSQQASDAIAALETLGFKKEASAKVIQKLCSEAAGEELEAATLIRRALSKLNS